MRLRTAAAVAAATVFGAGAAAVAAGRYVSGLALGPPPEGGAAGEPLTVHSTAPGQVTLTRTLASARPGVYGLAGRDCHVAVGEVLFTAPGSVPRRLERVQYGRLDRGTQLRLTPQVYAGDPRAALGLDHADVEVPGELGPPPAWFVPGPRGTWVLMAHGLGTTREYPMAVMPALHRLRLPVLDLAYRNDPGAPGPPTASGTWAAPNGATWTRRCGTRCGTGRSGSSCTAGRPVRRWRCGRPATRRCAAGSAA